MTPQGGIRQSCSQTSLVALLSTMVALGALSAMAARADSAVDVAGTQRFDAQMKPILESYLRIGNTLCVDSLDGVQEEAEAIAKYAGHLDSGSVSGEHAAHYKNVRANLKKAAEVLRKTKTLDDARQSFKELSMPMAIWATMSKPKNIDVIYCSMARVSWVQKQGKVRNPYYGPKMLECGEVVGGDSHEEPKH